MSSHQTPKRRRSAIEDKPFWVIDDWGGAADLGELFTWAACDGALPGKSTPAGPNIPLEVAKTLARMYQAGYVNFGCLPDRGPPAEVLLSLAANVKWIDAQQCYIIEDDSLRGISAHLTQAAYESYRMPQ